MRVSESNRPEYADGFVVIDDRHAPNLRHAIGSRIYRRRAAAEERHRVASLNNADGPHFKVVPVEGANDVFALDYLDASEVTIGANGYLSMQAWQPKGGSNRWG